MGPWGPWAPWAPRGPWAPSGPMGPMGALGPLGPMGPRLHNGPGLNTLQRDKRETPIYIQITHNRPEASAGTSDVGTPFLHFDFLTCFRNCLKSSFEAWVMLRSIGGHRYLHVFLDVFLFHECRVPPAFGRPFVSWYLLGLAAEIIDISINTNNIEL